MNASALSSMNAPGLPRWRCQAVLSDQIGVRRWVGGLQPFAVRNPFRYINGSSAVIRLTVMMYVLYPLSLRRVEDILFERGIDICRDTVRFWWSRYGPMFAAELRKRRNPDRSHSLWAGTWTMCWCGSTANLAISGGPCVRRVRIACSDQPHWAAALPFGSTPTPFRSDDPVHNEAPRRRDQDRVR